MSTTAEPLPARAYEYADGEPVHHVTDQARSLPPQPRPADTACPVFCTLPHTGGDQSHHGCALGEFERPGVRVHVRLSAYPVRLHVHIARGERWDEEETEELVLPPEHAEKLRHLVGTALVKVAKECTDKGA